jgi:long-chain fatty acid transport protein
MGNCRLLRLALGLACVPALAGQASAAAFFLKEQGATGQGNAFAGATAGAEDITFMFWNPAGLTRHDGNQAAAAASVIIPQPDFNNGVASTAAALGGVAIGGGNGKSDHGTDAVTTSLYGLWSWDSNLKFGLGVNTPWGLATNNGTNWVGRYHATSSSIVTVNANPAVAYKINNMISVGAGLQAQYIKAVLKNQIDFGTITVGVGGAPTAQDGRGRVEADDVAYGFNAGVLFEPQSGTRVGLAYRSRLMHNLDGSVTFFRPAGLGAGQTALLNGAGFNDTGVIASIVLPEIISGGVYHQINPQWAVMGEVQWTRWSRLQELRIDYDNQLTDSVLELLWDDSYYVALGATYRHNDNWLFRAGAGFDESPIPDSTRGPRLPDSDRYWASLGASYSMSPRVKLDFAYTHIFAEDAPINLTDTGAAGTPNRFRGNLRGEFEAAVDIFVVQAVVKF